MSRVESLSVYKQLVKSFVRFNKRSRIAQNEVERSKELALLNYKKLKLIQSGGNGNDLSEMINLKNEIGKLEAIDFKKDISNYFIDTDTRQLIRGELKQSSANSKAQIQHLKDISTFLTNQREYDELIERYNKYNLDNLDQNDVVKKTANRVGLNVPV